MVTPIWKLKGIVADREAIVKVLPPGRKRAAAAQTRLQKARDDLEKREKEVIAEVAAEAAAPLPNSRHHRANSTILWTSTNIHADTNGIKSFFSHVGLAKEELSDEVLVAIAGLKTIIFQLIITAKLLLNGW